MDDEERLDFENLRHMTASTRYHSESDFGFRNYFRTLKGSFDHDSLIRLKKKKYVTCRQCPDEKRDLIYSATRKGLESIGFTEDQIKRTMKEAE